MTGLVRARPAAGRLLLADNVLRSGSWNGQTLLDPAADPRFTAIIIPMRAGIAAAVFHSQRFLAGPGGGQRCPGGRRGASGGAPGGRDGDRLPPKQAMMSMRCR
jgi:hypothetical protein